MSCQQKKKDKRNIGSRMALYYRRRWVMPLTLRARPRQKSINFIKVL